MAKVLGGDVPSEASYQMCRTVGHAWDPFYPVTDKPAMGWRLSLRCTRCTSERHDLISPTTGDVLQRLYAWPDDYRLPKGDPRPTRQELRQSVFETLRTELRANNAIAVGSSTRQRSIEAASRTR